MERQVHDTRLPLLVRAGTWHDALVALVSAALSPTLPDASGSQSSTSVGHRARARPGPAYLPTQSIHIRQNKPSAVGRAG